MAVKDGKVSKLRPKTAAPALATPSIQKAAPGWENTMAVKPLLLPKNSLMYATRSIQKTAPGWESTMAVKDGKVSLM